MSELSNNGKGSVLQFFSKSVDHGYLFTHPSFFLKWKACQVLINQQSLNVACRGSVAVAFIKHFLL